MVEWCDDTAKNTGFAIETAEKEIANLNAHLGELASSISTSSSTIDRLAGSIAAGEAELKDATTIREKEVADFGTAEGELVDTIDSLGRAIGILSKEMAKNPAAFAQMNTESTANLVKALGVVLNAAAFPSQDQAKLTALVQSQQTEDADDLSFGAPSAATYKTHSTGILDVLEDLKEKAEGQLSDLRTAESNNKHNFEMLKQSLEDQIAADTKDREDEQAGKASATEAKVAAAADLDASSKSP